MTQANVSEFTQAFWEAFIWSTPNHDDAGDGTFDHLNREDFSPECQKRVEKDCHAFCNLMECASIEVPDGYDWGQAGHDFALTRNEHGTGFWDRPALSESTGKVLTMLSAMFPPITIVEGEDEICYVE